MDSPTPRQQSFASRPLTAGSADSGLTRTVVVLATLFFVQLTVLLTLLMLFTRATPQQRLQVAEAAVQWRFPEIRSVSAATLVQRLPLHTNDSVTFQSGPAMPLTGHPLVLDTRSAEEYAVSHLPGAKHAPTLASAQEEIATWRRANPSKRPASIAGPDVVLVCAVGWRSASLARTLAKHGETRLWNLEGGVFAWAQAGLPLVRRSPPESADQVHPWHPWLKYLLPIPARLSLP